MKSLHREQSIQNIWHDRQNQKQIRNNFGVRDIGYFT